MPPPLSPRFTFPFHSVSQPYFLSPQDPYLFRLSLVVFFLCYDLCSFVFLCFFTYYQAFEEQNKKGMRQNRMVGGRGLQTRTTSAWRKEVRHCPHHWQWKRAPEGGCFCEVCAVPVGYRFLLAMPCHCVAFLVLFCGVLSPITQLSTVCFDIRLHNQGGTRANVGVSLVLHET